MTWSLYTFSEQFYDLSDDMQDTEMSDKIRQL